MIGQMSTTTLAREDSVERAAPAGNEIIDAHVTVLTNFLGPHHLKQMREFQKHVRRLTILLSTVMEPNRDWPTDWEGMDIQVQKSRMITRQWRHGSGFREDNYVHVPWDTLKRLKQLKPDVIFSFEMGFRTLFSSLYRARNPHCRLVMVCNVSEQTEQGRGRLRQLLRSALRRRVDLVTTNGPSCTRYLRSLGYDTEQLWPYHYCHDVDKVFTGDKTFPQLPERLFHCGSLSERKYIVPFIDTLSTWCEQHPQRSIELVLAGRGPLESAIRNRSNPPNLRLTLLGSVDAATIRETYASVDMTVFPTLADEWGLVVNESMGSATPVLASVLAQATEVLCRDGINSWTFDPRDAQQMAASLDRALHTNGEQLKRMGQAGREAVKAIHVCSSAQEFRNIISAALRMNCGHADETESLTRVAAGLARGTGQDPPSPRTTS